MSKFNKSLKIARIYNLIFPGFGFIYLKAYSWFIFFILSNTFSVLITKSVTIHIGKWSYLAHWSIWQILAFVFTSILHENLTILDKNKFLKEIHEALNFLKFFNFINILLIAFYMAKMMDNLKFKYGSMRFLPYYQSCHKIALTAFNYANGNFSYILIIQSFLLIVSLNVESKLNTSYQLKLNEFKKKQTKL